ncbi:hypothetical protein BS17DRAFT_851932 [Gyrodon lividus]|nr:hypothetical protein BS17DRAFT_851932 [Gyrodon lividus]
MFVFQQVALTLLLKYQPHSSSSGIMQGPSHHEAGERSWGEGFGEGVSDILGTRNPVENDNLLLYTLTHIMILNVNVLNWRWCGLLQPNAQEYGMKPNKFLDLQEDRETIFWLGTCNHAKSESKTVTPDRAESLRVSGKTSISEAKVHDVSATKDETEVAGPLEILHDTFGSLPVSRAKRIEVLTKLLVGKAISGSKGALWNMGEVETSLHRASNWVCILETILEDQAINKRSLRDTVAMLTQKAALPRWNVLSLDKLVNTKLPQGVKLLLECTIPLISILRRHGSFVRGRLILQNIWNDAIRDSQEEILEPLLRRERRKAEEGGGGSSMLGETYGRPEEAASHSEGLRVCPEWRRPGEEVKGPSTTLESKTKGSSGKV